MKFSTRAIHSGQEPDEKTGAVITPLYLTSTFKQDGIGRNRGYEYSRAGNPTRDVYEKCLASLESAKYGLSFASGVAATMAALYLLKTGDRILASADIYGGTYRVFEAVLKQYGIHTDYSYSGESGDFLSKAGKNTKMIWIETPTNPLLKILDIKQISAAAKRIGAVLVVDNTFATPYFQRPLELGADIVIHSTTKYIGGHSDIIGGAALTSNREFYNKMKFYLKAAGSVASPFDSWLALRGLKTLEVRMKKHEENGFAVAQYLSKHRKIERVYYPGLKTHPGHNVAARQMSGFGGMVSFVMKRGKKDIEDFISNLKIFTFAESLGGVESLACVPSKMTHGFFSAKEKKKLGISENLIRLSAGIEDSGDLIRDLEKALGKT
ncbi:MAG TPA: PLP-dependent transferase [bacterium]|nr:PLP-dependent transferase [bacterium]